MSLTQTRKQFTLDCIGFRSTKNYEELVKVPVVEEVVEEVKKNLTIHEKINLRSHFADSEIYRRAGRPYSEIYPYSFIDWTFEKQNPISPQKCKGIMRVCYREYQLKNL